MLEIIQDFGYLGIFVTVFLEIGLMVFPLPGDTLLFATGILTEGPELNYLTLVTVTFCASLLAGEFGYRLGQKLDKETLLNNRFYKIKDSHLHKTEKFFEKYGFWAIVFSRFVPIVRNFINQILGIVSYDKKKFHVANIIASAIWPLVIVTLGKVLGKVFPNLIKFAELLIIVVVIILTAPLIHEFLWKRHRKARESA